MRSSVFFSDAAGLPAQPMQGVNVVARWVHPATRLPHGTFVASSVSGFLFTGNAGNWMSGFTDSTGQPLNRFGSDDTTLEGFFDLGGLQVPSGNSAHYQISVEPINPLWSEMLVHTDSTSQVSPSGAFTPINVTVTLGSVQQDIAMQSGAVQTQPW